MTDPTEGKSPGRRAVALLLLLALPLFLRLAPIDHGMPRNYLPDTHVVRSALGMAKDKHPVPVVGQYSTYPNLIPYALLPVYAGQFALGRATGKWGGAEEFKMHVSLRPQLVHLPARILIALLGALTPLVVFCGARAAGMQRGAWVAAWLVATGLLHTQFSVQERPWAAVAFFLALSVWAAVVHVRDGKRKHLLFSGLAAAGAFSCHQAGLPVLGVAGLAWLVGPRGWSGGELKTRLVEGVLCVALFVTASLVVGHPARIVHGPTDSAAVSGAEAAEGGEVGGIEFGGQSFKFGFRAESIGRLSKALFGYEPALLLLGLAGLLGAFRRRSLFPATGFLVFWAAVFLPNPNDHVRYLLPLALLLVYPAGIAAEALLSRPKGVFLLAPLLAVPLVQDLRFVWLLSQPDSRALVEEKLAAELPDDARVVVDFYGPLVDMDAASLERVEGWRELYTREAVRRDVLAMGPDAMAAGGLTAGIDAIRIEELVAGDERAGSWKPKTGAEGLGESFDSIFVDGLGVTHALVVDRGTGRAPWLGAWVAERGAERVFELDPSGGSPEGVEFMLPMELDFALTGLWSVDRAGPRIVLYRLGG